MGRLIEGMKELEVAELAFRFDIADFLKPGVEIQIQVTDFLEFSKRRDNGIVEFSDMNGGDFATEGIPHLVDKVNRVAFD
ncbi:MAG: hypothetical protein HOH14_09540 [Gammaproteobacteria bacterium]|nr:hypothetical protein [Gammaproteobacteria bacterium]